MGPALKNVKYAVLAGIVGLALIPGSNLVDTAVEVEPFKTAITLGFVRNWPFVVWAVAMVLLSVFVYKGYCRYLCPLGATMAVFGRLRLTRWIPVAPSVASPARPAVTAAPTRRSSRRGRLTTTSASSAWTAWRFTTAIRVVPH